MSENKPNIFHLFVYGTLRSPAVFRGVLGMRLVTKKEDVIEGQTVLVRRAVLNGYKVISPDNTYLYAVPDKLGRVQGCIIGPMPIDCLQTLRKYEGRNYSRRKVTVATKGGNEKATAFVANVKHLEHDFGYQFRDTFKQEILLHQKIDSALLETEKKHLHTDENLTRRAVGELHGSRIRDLIRKHFESGGISDYAIRHSLLDAPLPDFARISNDPVAQTMAEHYLSMVVQQVIFNQMEDRVHREFHYELDRMGLSETYYDRTVSSLAALRFMNSNAQLLYLLVADCLNDLSFQSDRLVDFVRWGIVAADSMYNPKIIKQHLAFIRNHIGGGYIPLGAELEFSNIGQHVITDPTGTTLQDNQYNGFLYFRDFGLDVLTWKLGGHIDDHYEKSSERPRRGFFEAALGNLSIQENISKPITDDPWVLNQLIHETRRFYKIAPHSVHISLQLRSSSHRPVRDKVLSLATLKGLFALGGDLGRDSDGRIVISRLAEGEIVSDDGGRHMQFCEISRRHSTRKDDHFSNVHTDTVKGVHVQQFKFLRLSEELNYELITMAIKGVQMSVAPGTFMTFDQYTNSRTHRRRFDHLMEWGMSPTPLSETDIETFLKQVYKGLKTERRGKSAHNAAYISWAFTQLRYLLQEFNNKLTAELNHHA